jgi:hypothetical protein
MQTFPWNHKKSSRKKHSVLKSMATCTTFQACESKIVHLEHMSSEQIFQRNTAVHSAAAEI